MCLFRSYHLLSTTLVKLGSSFAPSSESRSSAVGIPAFARFEVAGAACSGLYDSAGSGVEDAEREGGIMVEE